MATFTPFYSFTQAMAEGKFNLSTDTIKVMLTNVDPAVDTNSQFSELTDITEEHGYTAAGETSAQTASSTAGVYKLVLADVTWVAVGGSIGPFQYAVIYSDTATNKDLIGSTDYGSPLTIQAGQSFTEDFNATDGAIQI
jgi:hypothetical protein